MALHGQQSTLVYGGVTPSPRPPGRRWNARSRSLASRGGKDRVEILGPAGVSRNDRKIDRLGGAGRRLGTEARVAQDRDAPSSDELMR